MNTAPINKRASSAKASQSLYGCSAGVGKKLLRTSKLDDRKSLFKPPQNVMKPTRNSRIPNAFSRRVVPGSKDSLRLSRALSTVTDMQKLANLNKTFLRPPVDIFSVRKTLMERAQRLAESRIIDTDEKDVKVSHNPVKLENKLHTPISVTKKAYQILSEARRRSAKKPARVVQLAASEEESIIHRKSNLEEQKSTVKLIDVKENVAPDGFSPSPMKDFLKPCTREKSQKVNAESKGDTSCALSNVLKHCQLYSVKMSSINDAFDQLDDSFQRVMVGEIGGHIHAKFCDYQKKKLDLYRQMKLAEDQLEEAVTSEIDLQSKIKEYLRKRTNMFKERSTLEEDFKSTVKNLLEVYQERLNKPPKIDSFDEIVSSLLPSKKREHSSPGIKKDEIVLRRSKRLQTPKKVAASPRVLRSNSKKAADEEFVVKRSLRSADKRIQQSIYKDLQKGFNLYSPECSF